MLLETFGISVYQQTMHLGHINSFSVLQYFARHIRITQLHSTLSHGQFKQIQINLLNMPLIFWLIQITTFQWQFVIDLRVSSNWHWTFLNMLLLRMHQILNISEPHKEHLWWHYCLEHIGLRTAQSTLGTGALATSHTVQWLHRWVANIPVHDMPKCAACWFGKQTNQTVPGKCTHVIEERAGMLLAEKLQPGQGFSLIILSAQQEAESSKV